MAYAGSAVLEGDAAAFAAAVRSLINNPQFSDVTFVVGRERQEVFAHRCILACRCQAFQGMFSQPQPDAQEPWPPQAPLVLSHVQPEVFLAVLEFLYTNSVTLNSFMALEVLTSAVEYGLDDLRKVRPSPRGLSCLLLNTRVLGGQDGRVRGGDVRRARDCTFSPVGGGSEWVYFCRST
ncbi:BTB/POZ domain-containing protein 19 [Terrapene carolina triunguis]|uniref:BTB/POZ domain-containing protein 19 n=1 Tax=Terrapene triunguis TaxID=2587831 RepID=UPI001156B3C8|nr:BTB/POZ domain-containing protein 19 [Terrapene carolina triunguis]